MPTTSVFYREYLKEELERRKKRNLRYSLRSFARDLVVAPSWLSEAISGKKGISQKAAAQMAEKLNLKRTEFKRFVLSAKAAHSRKKSDRLQAEADVAGLMESSSDFKKIGAKDFNCISSWYFQAILEVTELTGFDHTADWIAKKLNLPLGLINTAIKKLVEVELIQIENGKIRSLYAESETDFDLPIDAIKAYHSEVLTLARNALFTQHVNAREFSNMTLAFDKNKIFEAKKFVRQFQKEFADKFYSKNSSKDSVYQLSMQLFRLDADGAENEN